MEKEDFTPLLTPAVQPAGIEPEKE